MRISLFAGLAALTLSLPCSCKSSDGTVPQGTPSPSPSPGTPTSGGSGGGGAPTPTPAAAPAAGGTCTPGPDSIACSAGAAPQELTCAGGTWRALQACRGPAGCKGTGSALHCDPGSLVAGDPCITPSAPARCGGKTLSSCLGGKWTDTACPTACTQGDSGPPACK